MLNWRLVVDYLKSDWRTVNKTDVLLVCSDSSRFYQFEGTAYAPLIDSVGDLLVSSGATSISISDRISRCFGKKGYQMPLTMNRELLFIKLIKRFLIGLRLNKDFVMRLVTSLEARYWARVLNQSAAKLVIGIQPNMPLCLACNRKGIPVYDLQHGVISDTADNPYYYYLRPYIFDNDVLPSGLLCWDQASTEVLKHSPLFGSKDILHVGNPWFLRFVQNQSNDRLVTAEREKLVNYSEDRPVILVTLQFQLDKFAGDYVDDGVMATALRMIILQKADDYVWLIRLHPSQLMKTGKDHINSYLEHHFGHLTSVDWEQSSKSAMPLLLKLANVHLTHFSATTVEAAWFGVPTGLIDPHICPGGKHKDFYRNEIDSGIAQVIQAKPEEIGAFISQKLTDKPAAVDDVLQGFWSSFLREKLACEQKCRKNNDYGI